MVNRPKNIGTAGESAVVKLLRTTYGFPEQRARRVTLSGQFDLGDVHAEFPRGELVAIEVKSGKQAGHASLLDIAKWQEEAAREAAAALAEIPLLVVKRLNYSDRTGVHHWRAFFPMPAPALDREVWVEMQLADAIEWLADMFGHYPRADATLVA